MTTEHHTGKKRNPAAPTSRPSGPPDTMTPDELVAFEEGTVHGDDKEPPADPADDPDRMTKSGRLNRKQVQDAIDASGKNNK